jgi:outer membrane protein OmpA-like peptidoglycan-associated protein
MNNQSRASKRRRRRTATEERFLQLAIQNSKLNKGRPADSAKQNFTELLSDEVVVDILIKYLPVAKTLAQVSGVSKRFQRLLQDEQVIKRVMNAGLDPQHRDLFVTDAHLSPFEQLGFYQSVRELGIFDENRIGFDFGSTDVDDDDGVASLIGGSNSRIKGLALILNQYENANIIVEAHCGTAAPAAIAPGFSRERGQSVCFELSWESHQLVSNHGVQSRITMKPWGRRVAERASASDHKHGIVAREGRGWVEINMILGDIELPRRPSYYEGVRLEDDEVMFRFRF